MAVLERENASVRPFACLRTRSDSQTPLESRPPPLGLKLHWTRLNLDKAEPCLLRAVVVACYSKFGTSVGSAITSTGTKRRKFLSQKPESPFFQVILLCSNVCLRIVLAHARLTSKVSCYWRIYDDKSKVRICRKRISRRYPLDCL